MERTSIDSNNVYVPDLQRGDLADYHLCNVVDKTWNYAGLLETERDHILNAVMGLGGEAGEIVDLHKKMLFHKPKDGRREELLHELGDVLYYFNKLRDLYGFSMKEIVEANLIKLSKRHADTYNRESLNVR